MSIQKYCPECKQILMTSTRCVCGWKAKNPEISLAPDHGCHYRSLGRRCPSLGTVSPSTRSNASWYCSKHAEHLHDARLCEAILIEAEKEHEQNQERATYEK